MVPAVMVAVAGLEHEIGPVVGISGSPPRLRRPCILHHAFRPQIGDHGIEHCDLDVVALLPVFSRAVRAPTIPALRR